MKSHLKRTDQVMIRLFLVIIILLFFIGQVMFTQQSPNIFCEDISLFLRVYGNTITKTLYIYDLAPDAVVFTKEYTTSDACAPSQSSIITGMHAISIDTQRIRTISNSKIFMLQGLPSYFAVLPDFVKAFPEYVKAWGYYITNSHKEDYQFEAPVIVWDDSGPAASYKFRPNNSPFFIVFKLAITYESKLMDLPDSVPFGHKDMKLTPYYVHTETVHNDMTILYCRYRTNESSCGRDC